MLENEKLRGMNFEKAKIECHKEVNKANLQKGNTNEAILNFKNKCSKLKNIVIEENQEIEKENDGLTLIKKDLISEKEELITKHKENKRQVEELLKLNSKFKNCFDENKQLFEVKIRQMEETTKVINEKTEEVKDLNTQINQTEYIVDNQKVSFQENESTKLSIQNVDNQIELIKSETRKFREILTTQTNEEEQKMYKITENNRQAKNLNEKTSKDQVLVPNFERHLSILNSYEKCLSNPTSLSDILKEEFKIIDSHIQNSIIFKANEILEQENKSLNLNRQILELNNKQSEVKQMLKDKEVIYENQLKTFKSNIEAFEKVNILINMLIIGI